MTFESLWQIDAFFWLVFPIALLEGVRVTRAELLLGRRSSAGAFGFGTIEAFTFLICAATCSPLVFIGVGVFRALCTFWREGGVWVRGLVKLALVTAAVAVLVAGGGAGSLATLDPHYVDPAYRTIVLLLLSAACVVAIVPVRLSDESKETLAAPFVLVAFARIALPLGAAEPRLALFAPVVAVALSMLCALWLLSAGMRANHFEHSTLVSELLVCERGVLLAFVWLGMASGEPLAMVGALLEWWAGGLALLALEAALRTRAIPKPMAFFALAMAVGIPGTTGFVAEDLLAHGLLELRPVLAAAFVVVGAINAAALYLALVNLIVDSHDAQHEPRPTAMMLVPAALSLLIGLAPRAFVASAVEARGAIARSGDAVAAEVSREASVDDGAF